MKNHYQLLGIEQTDNQQEIRTAYRQTSRTVHPDRNPSPDAALLFHALTEAFDLLRDPQRKAAYDLQLNAQKAKQERFASLDNKRKAQTADLEQREAAYKRSKDDDLARAKQRGLDIEALKAEGAKLRRDREAASLDAFQKATVAPPSSNGIPALDPLDTTLRLKWAKAAFPDIDSQDSLRALIASVVPGLDNSMESIVVSFKNKSASAVLSLKTLNAAVKLVQASSSNARLSGIAISWVKGEPPVAARRALGLDVANNAAASTQSTALRRTPTLSEDDVLAKMRARQAERQQMVQEIQRQEAAEEG